MSLNRYDAKRDANEGAIIRTLRAAGATVEQLSRPVDLLVGYRGETHTLEVKDPAQVPSKRRLTPDQEEWFRTWRGRPPVVILTPEEALRAIGALR